jgi:hypothetical protein
MTATNHRPQSPRTGRVESYLGSEDSLAGRREADKPREQPARGVQSHRERLRPIDEDPPPEDVAGRVQWAEPSAQHGLAGLLLM